jgi:GH15 family glucan-1,4-alpha-glucosidase
MYGIDGREDLPEQELPHLEGYKGSAPVRIGNGAATQLQLDIYGELMDSVYLCNKHGRPIYHDGWMELTRNLEWLMGDLKSARGTRNRSRSSVLTARSLERLRAE